jgi:hypothetical protein
MKNMSRAFVLVLCTGCGASTEPEPVEQSIAECSSEHPAAEAPECPGSECDSVTISEEAAACIEKHTSPSSPSAEPVGDADCTTCNQHGGYNVGSSY